MLKTGKTLFNGRKAMLGLVKSKFSSKRIPVRVSLLITKLCNLRCYYCYALDEITNKNIKDHPLDELMGLVDEIYESGCRWINILGGEPLLRKGIDGLIDHMHSKGMFIEITTNGFYVHKHIEALKKVDHVAISLDGNKLSNDKTRGKDSFEKIVKGIECAVENGIKVRIHATLCKRTMSGESFVFLTDFCKRLGLTLNYSENGLPGIEEMDPDFLLSEEETLDFYKSYRKLKKNGYPIVSSDVAVDYVAKWPLPGQTTIYKKDLDRIPKDSYYPCTLGRNQCFITSKGNVYSCTKRWGEGLNAYEVGFQAAWDDLADLDCVACKEMGTIEQSVITGLNPKAVWNAITNFV